MVIGICYFAGALAYASVYYDSSPTWFKVVMLLLLIATFGYALWQEDKTKDRIAELEAKVSELQRKDCKYITGTKLKCSKFENIQMCKNHFAVTEKGEIHNG